MAGQFFDHSQTEDGLLAGVVKYVEANQSRIQIPVIYWCHLPDRKRTESTLSIEAKYDLRIVALSALKLMQDSRQHPLGAQGGAHEKSSKRNKDKKR